MQGARQHQATEPGPPAAPLPAPLESPALPASLQAAVAERPQVSVQVAATLPDSRVPNERNKLGVFSIQHTDLCGQRFRHVPPPGTKPWAFLTEKRSLPMIPCG